MNTTTTTTKKTTQGRQRIEIKKIDNISNRQVTFSKRRAGLFKKAGELCILSGAQVAIIVKSPGKRTFAFGHPNVATVLDRYLAGKNSGAAVGGGAGFGSSPCAAANHPSAREFNERYNEVAKELEAEKRRSTEIEGSKARNDGVFWWNETVDDLGLEELEQYVASLEELKKNVAMRVDEIMLMKVSTMNSSVFGLNPSVNCGGGGGGGLVADHFANHDHCGSTNSVVPLGFDFGRG